MTHGNTPTFSIVVPTFNRRDQVLETVRSVLDQSERDLELIVVDDGSTDDTVEKLNEVAASDSRLTVVRRGNSGRSVARNSGFEKSSGRWIVFLDSDDLLEPTALRTFANLISEYPDADILAGSKSFIGLDGEPIPPPWKELDPDSVHGLIDEPYVRLIRQFFFTPGSYCVRREKCPRFKKDFEPCEDYEFLLSAAIGARVVRSREEVLRYRWHDGNTPQERFASSRLRVSEYNESLVDSLPESQRRRARAEWANRRADDFYEQGKSCRAFLGYLRAAVINPAKLGEGQIPRQLAACLVPSWLRRKVRNRRSAERA